MTVSVRAQFFSESFNSAASFSSWTLINQDGRTPAGPVSQFTDAWILDRDSSIADSCASSTSWYVPAGQADDWLISPPIQLATTSILSWDAQAQDNLFPDGYEVRISAAQPTISDFNLNPPVFQISGENPNWTRRSVNLQAKGYSNQTVYLAWRNNSNDQFILSIDNIRLDSISGSDANLITAQNTVDEFWQVPLQYADTIKFASAIENIGADTLFNLTTTYEVFRNNILILRDSMPTIAALAPADTAVMQATAGYLPIQSGDYHVRYYPSFSVPDIDSSNNFYITDTITISDTTYARDNGVAIGSIGIGKGVRGEIGSIYSISSNDTLSSVSIYIVNGTGEMTGQPISLNIRSFTTIPGSIIASSDTLIYTASGASWVHFDFARVGGAVPLNAGTFYIGVVEPDSNVSLGTSSRTITPSVNYLDFPGNPQNGWTTLDVFNLFRCLMIRPNFAPQSIPVALPQLSDRESRDLKVYPNPSADGIFYISEIHAEGVNANVQVYDLNGKVVTELLMNNRGKNRLTFDLSSSAKGMYFLRIEQGDDIQIKKLIIH
jgi:hypothetical protein